MHVKSGKVGVLYVSLGTPESPNFKDVRSFLAEFLSDPAVVDLPRIFWLPLLYGVILNTRPFKSGKAYAKVWNYEAGESPLKTIARAQATRLQKEIATEDIIVEWAFRYGKPAMREKIIPMIEAGCDRILVVALFPQYSNTTSGSVYTKTLDILKDLASPIELRTMPAYYQNPLYIKAVRDSVVRDMDKLDWEPDVLLASYHSIPKKYCDNGDPYRDHCEETTRLLIEAFQDKGEKIDVCYQSRLGKMEWLRPYSIDKVSDLAKSGVKNLIMFAPCFAQDCLETLEEIDMELRETFLSLGGKNFHYVKCLNAEDNHIALLKDITMTMLKDWR